MRNTSQTRVLVADRLRDSADSLADLLSLKGLQARAVYNVADALEACRSWKPDAAVIDLDLAAQGLRPMDLRAVGVWGTKLIAMSAWPEELGNPRARVAGYRRVLLKPLDIGDLLDELVTR